VTSDAATLARLLGAPVAEVADEPVDGKSHSGSGLRRLRCRMADGTERSVVRKVCRPSALHARDPGYARREADCYAHGLFDGLDGRLRVPRAYGWEERPDGAWWLWLEDLGDAFAVDWTPELLAGAVRDLAELHARWWGRSDELASMPFLRRRALLGDGRAVERIAQHFAAVEAHPRRAEIGAVFTSARRALLGRLAAAADPVLPAMDALAQTLLHQDVWPPNLGRHDRGIVLIDWAFAGLGSAGSELSQTCALLFQMWGPETDDLALLRALHAGLTEDWAVDAPYEELLAGYELGFCLRPAHALGGPILGGILAGRPPMVGSDDLEDRLAAAEATFRRVERGAARLGVGTSRGAR
jgi:hypothetical protein